MQKKIYKITESQLNLFLEKTNAKNEIKFYEFEVNVNKFTKEFIKNPLNKSIDVSFFVDNYGLSQNALRKILEDENILIREVKPHKDSLDKSTVKYKIPSLNLYKKIRKVFSDLSNLNEGKDTPYNTNVSFDDRIYITRSKKSIPLSQGAVDGVVKYHPIKEVDFDSDADSLNESKDKKLSKFLEKFKEGFYDDKGRTRGITIWGGNKKVENWPNITYGEGGEHPDKVEDKDRLSTESLDLENCEYLELTDDKFVFRANGDWQYPYVVTIKLVNGKLKVTDSHPSKGYKKDGKAISENDILKKLGVYDEFKAKEKELNDEKHNKRINADSLNESEVGELKPKPGKYIAYHSTNNKFDTFDFKRSPGGVVWFTDSLDSIKNNTHGAAGNKYIMKRELVFNNPAGWDEYDKYGLGQIEDKGYDGIILPDDGETTFIVFYPKSIKKINESIETNSNIIRFNSLGEEIANTEEELNNFWRWFGNSRTVDKEGRPIVLHHGSKADFEEFDPETIKYSGNNGDGFYFSPDYNESRKYGENVRQFYVKIDNPLSPGVKTLNVDDYKNIIDTIYNDEEYSDFLGNYGWFDKNKYVEFRDKLANDLNTKDDYMGLFDLATTATGSIRYMASISKNYDGVISTSFREYVAFSPNQIKSLKASRFDGESNNISEDNTIIESFFNKISSEGLLNEDLSKSDVKDEIEKFLKTNNFLDIIRKEIISQLGKSKDVENKMVEISSNVLVQLYKSLWTKRGFWKGDLKNSAS